MATVAKPTKRPRMKSFIYEKLPVDHIRILQVTCGLKRGGQRTISTRLQPFHIKQLPYFVALSYAWPDAVAGTLPLRCNNQHITVSTHVYTAFENLCPPDATCSFAIWVDAICIDQDNGIEKNHQVSHLGSIYGLASQVIVWLGPNKLVDQHRFKIAYLAHWVKGSPEEDWKSIIYKPPFPAKGDAVRKAIDSILLSPWFRRLWVVQEVCLGRKVDVLCGHCFLPWESLRVFFLWMTSAQYPYLVPGAEFEEGNRQGHAISSCRIRAAHDREYRYSYHCSGLIHTLDGLRSQNASKPIDMVFGLVFVLPEELRRHIVIDYSLENQYWKTYVYLSRTLLPQPGGLRILSIAPSENRAPELPSWCPDWNIRRKGVPEEMRLLVPDMELSNNEGCSSIVRFGGNLRHLQVRGFQIDQIAHSIPGLRPADDHDTTLYPRWFAWQLRCLHTLKTWLANDADPMLVLRSHLSNLTCGKWHADDPDGAGADDSLFISESDWPEMYDCYHELVSYWDDIQHKDNRFPFDMSDKATKFHMSLQMADRSYFLTKNGRVGRGCYEDRPGDILVMLQGAATPFILRYEEGSDVATLIGDASLNGCMNVNAMPKAGREPNRWFTIA